MTQRKIHSPVMIAFKRGEGLVDVYINVCLTAISNMLMVFIILHNDVTKGLIAAYLSRNMQ